MKIYYRIKKYEEGFAIEYSYTYIIWKNMFFENGKIFYFGFQEAVLKLREYNSSLKEVYSNKDFTETIYEEIEMSEFKIVDETTEIDTEVWIWDSKLEKRKLRQVIDGYFSVFGPNEDSTNAKQIQLVLYALISDVEPTKEMMSKAEDMIIKGRKPK